MAAQPVASALAGIDGDFDQITVWDNDQIRWKTWRPDSPDNEFDHFQPGDSIWIHILRETDLTIVNSG
jgi:hypothetical protein